MGAAPKNRNEEQEEDAAAAAGKRANQECCYAMPLRPARYGHRRLFCYYSTGEASNQTEAVHRRPKPSRGGFINLQTM